MECLDEKEGGRESILKGILLPHKKRCLLYNYVRLLLQSSSLDADAHLHTVALPQTCIRGDDRGGRVLGLSLLELRGVGDTADESSTINLLDLHIRIDDRGRSIPGLGLLKLSISAVDGAVDSTLTDDLLLGNTIDDIDRSTLSLRSRGVLGLSLLELRVVGDTADESSTVDSLDLGVRIDDRGRSIPGLGLLKLSLSAAVDGAVDSTLLYSLLLSNTIDDIDGGTLSLRGRGVLSLSLLELRGVGDTADESSTVDSLDLSVRIDDRGRRIPGLGLLKLSTLLNFSCNLIHYLQIYNNNTQTLQK